MKNINKAIEWILSLGGDFEGKKDEYLIEKAESKLGVRFPPSYRYFLKTLGCGDVEGLEFYGLIDDNFEASSVPNAIWLTMNERQTESLPDFLILIYTTGDGTYYAIDTRHTDEEGECPVVSYGIDGIGETVAPDFGTFLLKELELNIS